MPTDGDIDMGAPSGTTNSNEVSPTGAISPEITSHTGSITVHHHFKRRSPFNLSLYILTLSIIAYFASISSNIVLILCFMHILTNINVI